MFKSFETVNVKVLRRARGKAVSNETKVSADEVGARLYNYITVKDRSP